MRNRKKIIKYISYGFIAFVVIFLGILTFIRLYKGVELSDESYYLAMAIRLLQGDRPYIEALDIHIGSACFSAIPLFIFKIITGSYDGSMLYMRQVYFAFCCLIAFAIGVLMKNTNNNKSYAFLSVIPILFFAPYSIATFSYNTISVLLFTFCVFLIFCSYKIRGTKECSRLVVISGVISSIYTYVYPTYIVTCVVIPILIYVVFYENGNRVLSIKSSLQYISGGIISAVIIIGILIMKNGSIATMTAGIKEMLSYNYFDIRSVRYSNEFGWFNEILAFIKTKLFYAIILISILNVLIIWISKKSKRVIFLLPILTGLSYICLLRFRSINSFEMSEYIYLLSFILCTVLTNFIQDKKEKKIIFAVIVLSMICPFVKTYSSVTAGFFESLYSALPLVIIISYVIIIILNEHDENNLILAAIVPITLSVLFVVSNYFFVYRDASVMYLNQKIESGVYKGIETTLERKVSLTDLQRRMDPYIDQTKKILIANSFAGGYLLAPSMRVASPTVSDAIATEYGFTDDGYLIEYFSVTKDRPDVIFVVGTKDMKYDINSDAQDFNKYLSENYEMVYKDNKETFPLVVYALNDTCK